MIYSSQHLLFFSVKEILLKHLMQCLVHASHFKLSYYSVVTECDMFALSFCRADHSHQPLRKALDLTGLDTLWGWSSESVKEICVLPWCCHRRKGFLILNRSRFPVQEVHGARHPLSILSVFSIRCVSL